MAAGSGSHPPAWYPDPGHGELLRRWDGRAWTDDVRPLPAWMRTLPLADGPRGRRPHLRAARVLWIASATCVVSALAAMGVVGNDALRGTQHVSDRTFLARAAGACARADRVGIRPNLEPHRGESDVAYYERLLDAQEALVDELRDLPVAAADQAAVDTWIVYWDAWTTSGSRYVQALADGDEQRAEVASDQSRDAKAAIDAFASANGIPDCILFRWP